MTAIPDTDFLAVAYFNIVKILDLVDEGKEIARLDLCDQNVSCMAAGYTPFMHDEIKPGVN